MTEQTSTQLLGRVRRAARKRRRAEDELEQAILAAATAKLPTRLIGIAADLGHATVARIIVRARS